MDVFGLVFLWPLYYCLRRLGGLHPLLVVRICWTFRCDVCLRHFLWAEGFGVQVLGILFDPLQLITSVGVVWRCRVSVEVSGSGLIGQGVVYSLAGVLWKPLVSFRCSSGMILVGLRCLCLVSKVG